MIKLFLLEKETAFKGWMLATVVAFPFTFLPVLFKDGPLLQRLVERIPESLLYSAGFGVAIVIAAVYQNYTRVKTKIDHYNKPAIKSLEFVYASAGQKSLVEDLNFYLVGVHKDRKYRIDMIIDLEEHNRDFLLINPIIVSVRGADYFKIIKELKELLRREFKVSENPHQLEILINLNEINLEDELAVKKYLSLIESKIS